jgi:hypothetical protein
LIPRRGKRFLPAPQCEDRLWGPPSLISNGYHGLFPQGKSGRDVKLTTHLHLVLRLRMVELYLHILICLYGIVLNYTIMYKDNFAFTGFTVCVSSFKVDTLPLI